jgi:3-methyladenine DNA glycosylase AlkD
MDEIPALLAHLRSLRNDRNIAGQRRFGITPQTEQLGIPIPVLRRLARPLRRRHDLALALWAQPVHEARLLAAFIEDPECVTVRQMEAWARSFDSWDVCDQVCGNVFDRTPHAIARAHRWSARRAEFVKRAGFVLMASLVVHRKELPDDIFLDFLPVIAREATDGRNCVKKAVNWALRQIGKRNPRLRRAAIAEARRIQKLDSRAARWIAADALRELRPAGW